MRFTAAVQEIYMPVLFLRIAQKNGVCYTVF